jgi:hypothetical protein
MWHSARDGRARSPGPLTPHQPCSPDHHGVCHRLLIRHLTETTSISCSRFETECLRRVGDVTLATGRSIGSGAGQSIVAFG